MSEEERKPYIVGAIKIPPALRDVAHAVITPEDDRAYFNVIGADDTLAAESRVDIGEAVTYRVELTEEEAERFRAASNARYVEPDVIEYDDAGVITSPAASSMRFMRADFPRVANFHGRDVLIGMLDGGSSAAVRNFLGVTMVAKQTFGPDQPGADEITSSHGCLVLPCLVPPGGRFLDAIVSSDAGTRSVADSVAGARWCADQGAKVINYSGSGQTASAAWNDGLQYLLDRGIQFVASAGNDNLASLNYPARLSQNYSNCHSSISFDENTGARSVFSCHDATGSGCAPGTKVLGCTPTGFPVTWDGTSASSPHMALLIAMALTAARFTPTQVGAAFKANCRSTGQPASEQGGGAYSLEAALTALGAFNGLAALPFRRNLCPNPSFEVSSAGYSAAAARTGITVAAIGRFSTIATPFGTVYAGVNVTGDGSTSAGADAEIVLPVCPVTAGLPYTFYCHPRSSGANTYMAWYIRWENAAGTNLGVVNGPEMQMFTTVWPRQHITATAPPGATRAVLKLLGANFLETAVRSWRVDGFFYEQSTGPGTYFDGATSGSSWEGAAGISTSIVGTPAGGGGTTPPAGGGFTANLYVATTGSDSNPGTSAALPKLTIGAALTAATAGQTISVADGVYPGITTSKGGTAGNYITIRSATKHGARLTSGCLIQHEYIRLQDFEITGAGIVYACDVVKNNVNIKGNKIHGIAKTTPTGDGSSAIEAYTSDGNYGPMSNVVIEDNLIYDVGVGLGDNQLQQGIYITGNGQGTCIVRNNVVYGVTDFGIHGYSSSGITQNWVIVNNTVASCGRGILSTGGSIVRNNIAYNNGSENFDLTGGTVSNNLSGGTGNVTGTGITGGVNPLFVNAAGGDYHLQAGSPAINAGTASNAPAADYDGKVRPLAGSHDVGAFEYGSTAPPVVEPPPPTGGGGQGPQPDQPGGGGSEEPIPQPPKRVSDEIMTVLQGIKGKREWRFRYELLTAENNRIRDLDNVLGGSIAHDFFAEIKRTAKFTLKDDGSINFLTQRIRPWAGILMPDGTWQEWSQGVFLMTTPTKSVDISGSVIRDVEAYDQTVVLLDDTVGNRYFIGANVEYTEAIQELLQDTPGIPSFSIASSTTRTPYAMEWEPGTPKLRIISDLLAAINYGSLWFDGSGTLKAAPYVAPSLREADFHYETNEVSVILADAEQNLDMFQIPNRWVLIVSNPDQPPLRAEITNNSPLSPTSTLSRGRIITRVVTDAEAPNQAVLNSLAERLRDEDGQVFEHVSFGTGLMPFHENGDCYDFIHYDMVVTGRFMETKWSMNLTQGAEMKHEARRTVSVLGGFGIGPFGLAPFGA